MLVLGSDQEKQNFSSWVQ